MSSNGFVSYIQLHTALSSAVRIHLDGFDKFHIENVVGVVERRETLPLREAAISLLPTHHDPQGTPLGHVYRLDHPRDFVDKADGTSYMVQDLAIANLLPRHVLQQLQNSLRHVLESVEVDARIGTKIQRHDAVHHRENL